MATTQFFPVPTVTVDGAAGRGVFPGEAWATIRDGAGTESNYTNTTEAVVLNAASDANTWGNIRRAILLFDTSAIGSDTPATATLNLFVTGKLDDFGLSLDIVAVTPSSNTTVVNGDYSQFSTTLLGTVSVASLAGGQYNAIILNAAGLAAIATGGITKLGLRTSADRTNTEPTWVVNGATNVTFKTAETSGTSNDPYLEVSYASIAVVPGTKALTLTTFAPSINTPVVCTPDVKALTLTKYAPTIKLAIIPPTRTLTLTTFAPTVLAPRLVTPPTTSLTITPLAPQLQFGFVPATKSLSLTTYSPQLRLTVTPNTRTLTLTTFAPGIILSSQTGITLARSVAHHSFSPGSVKGWSF